MAVGTLSFLSPVAALVAVAVVPALFAAAGSERRSRVLCRVLGLPARGPASVVGTGLALAGCAACLALAAAQPVVGKVRPVQGRQDAEVLFVFDISRSMLAGAGPGAPTRFTRARVAARAVRARLPELPVGVVSMTDRVLPHLFPTLGEGFFDATVDDALGIERPPPDKLGRGRATSLGSLGLLATRNFFGDGATRRVAVLFTDGESLPYDALDLRDRLGQGNVTLVVVRIWARDERIYDTRGNALAAYRPDPAAQAALDEDMASVGARVLRPEDVDGIAEAVRRAVGSGPVGPSGRELQTTALAPYAVLGSFLPVAFLLWRRNL
jgi:hypothetical protein